MNRFITDGPLNLLGGKAYNLKKLQDFGVRVPSWFVVISSEFSSFLKNNFKDENIFDNLTEKEIEKLFLNASFDQDFKSNLQDMLQKEDFKSDYYSVRSSSMEEDSNENSFAGQFSSFLYVSDIEDIIKSIKLVYASVYSERARSYRKQKSLESKEANIAVIIQKMVKASASGVLFTRNPINPLDRDNSVISSSFGVGEGIVSGLVVTDEFKVNRKTFKAIKNIQPKSYRLDFDGKNVVQIKNEHEIESSLKDKEIDELLKISLELEAKFKKPLDIEFSIEKDKIYILQARPITHLPNDFFFDEKIMGAKTILWDNSNIIESYAGVTSPLTFSFASYVYKEVYKQFLTFMGVKDSIILKREELFRNLLLMMRGQIYYNLVHWYELVLMLPGTENNKEFLETMMGVKKGLGDEAQDLFSSLNIENKKTPISQKVNVLFKTVKNFIFIDSIIKNFTENFNKIYEPLRKKNFKESTLTELNHTYSFLENEVLRSWKAPIINDYLCMIFFGLLKKTIKNWLPHVENYESLQNDLLCGEGNLESTEPTKHLMRLAAEIDKNNDQRSFLLNSKDTELLESIEFKTLIYPFLDKYGFRCANELKLEENDLNDDPTFIIHTLKSYVRSKSYNIEEMEKREKEIRLNAEKIVFQNLKGYKKFLFTYILKQARKAVRNRENLRFLRTKIFGITRNIFRAIGAHFSKLGLVNEERDIFFLKIDEIREIIEGRTLGENVITSINERKKVTNQYKKGMRAPDRFITKGASSLYNPYPQVLASLDLLKDHFKSDDPNILIGTPCSQGVVEGEVRVVREFKDAKDIDGHILVTERTDPGWVPLYPSVKALVIERGSLLSHSAVVARELGLPTIIGVHGGLMTKLQSGDIVRVDGTKGTVQILMRAND